MSRIESYPVRLRIGLPCLVGDLRIGESASSENISVNSTPRDLASFLAASHSSRITHLALLMIHLNILSVFSDKKGKPRQAN